MEHVRIDPAKIPAADLYVLCATVLDAVMEENGQSEEWQRNCAKEENAE